MSWLAWIIVGIIAGWLAKMVIPGEGPGGMIGDLVSGSSEPLLEDGFLACSGTKALPD